MQELKIIDELFNAEVDFLIEKFAKDKDVKILPTIGLAGEGRLLSCPEKCLDQLKTALSTSLKGLSKARSSKYLVLLDFGKVNREINESKVDDGEAKGNRVLTSSLEEADFDSSQLSVLLFSLPGSSSNEEKENDIGIHRS